MDKESKKEIISKYKLHGKDGGSSNVQIAILSKRIADLTEHLKIHKKDMHTRYGLLKMVSKRRRLINYLKKNDSKTYVSLAEKLGLK